MPAKKNQKDSAAANKKRNRPKDRPSKKLKDMRAEEAALRSSGRDEMADKLLAAYNRKNKGPDVEAEGQKKKKTKKVVTQPENFDDSESAVSSK